jgi:spectrin beta
LLQFNTNANESESWLNEKVALVASADCGEDEPSAEALLQRHCDLQGELDSYSGDTASLNSQVEKLVQVKRGKMCHHMEQCAVS